MHATADQLRRVTRAILKSGGSAAPEADLVADHLVQANLAGHDSHGVGMIPAYVRHLKAGLVVPNTRAKLVKDDGAMLMFDGGRGYGRSVAGETEHSRAQRGEHARVGGERNLGIVEGVEELDHLRERFLVATRMTMVDEWRVTHSEFEHEAALPVAAP